MAGPDRPLLDIAARFRADGGDVAAGYYSDGLHQSDAGQQVIAEMATNAVLSLAGAQVSPAQARCAPRPCRGERTASASLRLSDLP